MKIAFLNIYNGVVNRGAETFVKEVASRLSENYKVAVFQAGEKRSSEKYDVERVNINFDWTEKSAAGTFSSFLFLDYWSRLIVLFSLKAAKKIWREKYDVVIPINGGWQPAIVRLVTWLYGGKMIISGQSGMGWDDRNNLWCFPNCFIALSSLAKKWAKKANPFVKVEYIPNGVDTKKFTPNGEKLKTNLKKPIVLYVAALTKTKRIDLAIKAVAKLEDVSLLVVGDGGLRFKIYNLGLKILGKRFQLIRMPYEDMPKVYRATDIFTIPSESYYSFENVIVEAMASGLGVVANDDPIRKEIVGDAGILVDPTDTEAYAEALLEALKRNWGEAPRRQAEKFDWDEITQRYQDLFDNLNV